MAEEIKINVPSKDEYLKGKKFEMLQQTGNRLKRILGQVEEMVNDSGDVGMAAAVSLFGTAYKQEKLVCFCDEQHLGEKIVHYGLYQRVGSKNEPKENTKRVAMIRIPVDFGEWYGVEDIGGVIGGSGVDQVVEDEEDVVIKMADREFRYLVRTMADIIKKIGLDNLSRFGEVVEGGEGDLEPAGEFAVLRFDQKL